MKRLTMSILIGLVFFVLGVLSAAAPPTEWRAKMNELAKALADTVPYLNTDPSLDPKGFTEKVKKVYDITQELKGGIKHSMSVPDDDPALPYVADLMNEDLERAYKSLEDGHNDYAKGLIRSSISYCISCHTRMEGGTQFPALKAFEKSFKTASWIEKIELQAATRQFDSVLKDVDVRLKSSGQNSMDMERAVRIALAIAVRVKKDPTKAAELAANVSKSKLVSEAMRSGAKVWLEDIGEWKKESGRTYKSDSEMIEAARGLMKKIMSSDQYSLGGNGEVRLLRASVLMHDLIKRYPKSTYLPEALYIIGMSYDVLRDLGLWSLHELYFLACVDKAPHTPMAQKCFKRYEESVTLGYTGSAGTHIPSSVRKYLDSVRKKAMPSTKG